MSTAPSYAPNADDWASTGYAGPASGTSGTYTNPNLPPGFGSSFGPDDWFNFGISPQAQGFSQSLLAQQAMAGPQFALNQIGRDSILSQIAAQSGQYGLDSSYLKGSNANQLAQLGLKEQGIGIDRAAVDRRGGYLTNLHDIAGQVFDLQGTEAWQQAGKEQRSTRSAAIASGGNTSIGLNQSMTDIANDLTNRGKEIDLSRQRETTQFNEDFASNTDAGKQLDLQAQSLGIDRNQLALELQHGLDQLGLSNSFSLQDLYAKMQSSNLQDVILAQQIWNEALKNSDYYATSPTSGTSGSIDKKYAGGHAA